jgi:hypothetical protein
MPMSPEYFFKKHRSRRPVRVADDDGWIARLTKIAPIMSGVGSLGSFINGVIAARQTAQFQKELISALQTIESQLDAIKNDLDAIYQELKDIETEIAGLGLNDKLTAIETWGMEMAALEPDDKEGAAHLATAMMDAKQGATNLLGCMLGLHNALVGQGIGKPLIQLLDAQGFLQVRARLVQGLHLLAFGCAFNTKEEYDYGVFLQQWAANFELEASMYFASGKDVIPMFGNTDPNYPPQVFSGGDCIVIYKTAQSELPNVAFTADGTGQVIPAYINTIGIFKLDDDPTLYAAYPSPWDEPLTAYVDMLNNVSTLDGDSDIAKQCWAGTEPDRYLMMILIQLGAFVRPERAKLVCGARFNPAQTFLGAVNGQIAWLSADDPTYLGSIHDGDNPGASLLTYDAAKVAVSAHPFSSLQSLGPAFWTVNWVSKGVITIAASQPATAPPAFLSLDGNGNWIIATSPVNLNVAAAAARIGPITNPFAMPPTPASISTAASAARTVLFHQL